MRVRDDQAQAPAPAVLIPPYGDRLVDLLVPQEERADLRAYAARLPSVRLSERRLSDLELLAIGGFSPLDQFMTAADCERVMEEMRLASGHVFPIPVTLPIEENAELRLDRHVALRGPENELLAIMTVEEIYPVDWRAVAAQVLRTQDPSHPLVAEMRGWGRLNVSGRLRVFHLPEHWDFPDLRLTPAQTRARLQGLGRNRVVAFQTRNPLHRGHEELLRRAMAAVDGVILLHPAVGLTMAGDVDHYTRVRTYRAVARHYPPDRLVLALLPLAMWLAGPREAVWHALIRRNYGATHFIVGRRHASPGANAQGEPFYGPYDAHELLARVSAEIGITMLPFGEIVYLPEEGCYRESTEVTPGTTTLSLSGTRARNEFVRRGSTPPEWFVRPEVAEILSERCLPRHRQGVCVWLTGLSGAGKSATAQALAALLAERGRAVTLLDGDLVRHGLSSELKFSRADRDENVRRIGLVASEVVRHGGIAVCAVVSPYRAAREEVRRLIGADQFIEVFVDTPLEICERRDPKGLYARARSGELAQFTGVTDPYEAPLHPDIHLDHLDAAASSVGANAQAVLDALFNRGFVEHRDRHLRE